jgi:hypothetical protein
MLLSVVLAYSASLPQRLSLFTGISLVLLSTNLILINLIKIKNKKKSGESFAGNIVGTIFLTALLTVSSRASAIALKDASVPPAVKTIDIGDYGNARLVGKASESIRRRTVSYFIQGENYSLRISEDQFRRLSISNRFASQHGRRNFIIEVHYLPNAMRVLSYSIITEEEDE